MNFIIVYRRLCAYLSIALTLSNLPIQAANVNPISQQHTPLSECAPITGQLSNGLAYTCLPSDKLNDRIVVKLSIQIPYDAKASGRALLTQYALFYGTEKLNQDEIAQQLNELGLDVYADSFVQADEVGHSIQFDVSLAQPSTLNSILTLLQQLSLQPTLTNEAIELARLHLLDKPYVEEFEGLKHQISSSTVAEVRDFHQKWYRPDLMHIFLTGKIEATTADLIAHTFNSIPREKAVEPSVRLAQLANQNLSEEISTSYLSALANRVEFISGEKTYVVDGKIWMNPPSWMNKSSNGKAIGMILTVLGIGSLILLAPIAAPIALLGGGMSTVAGVYLLSCGYLKDPLYVEKKREEDLTKGFEHAYRHKRAGITLTPYERRHLFLQGMTNQIIYKNSPSLLLADLYELSDPAIFNLFNQEEINYLHHMKRTFVQQRNQYKMSTTNLKKELADRVAPYAYARDVTIAYARNLYDQDDYVKAVKELKLAYEENVEKVEKAYRNGEVNASEKQAYLAQEAQYYEGAVNSMEFKNGLGLAEATLKQMENEACAIYALQVEQCKHSIRYEQRMEVYKRGIEVLIADYDVQLRIDLELFPSYETSLPDFMDLRTN